MKTLSYAAVVLFAGLALSACSSEMHDEKMMDEGKKTSMSDDKMAKDDKMMAKDDKMMAKDEMMAGDKMMTEGKMMSEGDMMMPTGVMVETSAMGKVLTDKMGMTLYTFDKDHPGMSACYDNCAKNWPPLMASSDAKPTGDFTVVTRKDGTMQWALKGMPLYTWVKDGKPGDVTGDGVGGVWHAAMPAEEKMMKK